MNNRVYFLKRSFDFLLAVAGIFFSSPLWLIFAFAIYLEDGIPVIYCQERVGKDGKVFKSIKFRSMIKDAEKATGPIMAAENDSRVTRIGRFLRRSAMDELPQLLNIAKGQMSFVGPRPLRASEMDMGQATVSGQDKDYYRLRLMVRPGLTGVAQVYAPRDISFAQKAKLDLWYIEHQSVYLDIKLILYSFWVSLNRHWDTAKKGFSAGSIYESSQV
jgi:lipopolysaccharide/colanic/teichoic acid biosynthesis glycosyltransferase